MQQRGRLQGPLLQFLSLLALPVTEDGAATGPGGGTIGTSPTFDADRREGRWYNGAPVPVGDSVSGAIRQFSPKDIPDESWSRIGDVVRRSVEMVTPPTAYRAGVYLNSVTQLAYWADTIGQSIEPDNLFHPETIERFITERISHLTPGTQTNYRSQLRAVGRAVIGATLYPPTGKVSRPEQKPAYTPDEVNALVFWASSRATAHLRRNSLVLLALGLGVGLTSQEMSRLTGDDVFADDDGVIVRVIGAKAREVPVLRRWEDDLESFARESGRRPVLLPDRTRIVSHSISNFVDRCSRGGAPGLSVQRLRTTWIMRQMTSGTPLAALSTVAGVDATHLSRYFELMPSPDLDELRQRVRDAGP